MLTDLTASLISSALPASRAPAIEPASPLLFVINATSGQNDSDTTRHAIEEALSAAGRTGELLFARPDEIARNAVYAAATATARHSAVVAVGGDGTINTVARAALAER